MLHLESFFDEMEKIGDLASAAATLLKQTITHPGQALYRAQQLDEGVKRHKQTSTALKYGYPTGWVPLGMRPR